MLRDDKSKYLDRYKNIFLEREKENFLSCKVKKHEMSKPTSQEMDSFINLHTYSYLMSLKRNDWINETIMLIIGALASVLLSNFANSIIFATFNYFSGFLLLILILIRVLRSRT